MSAPTASTPATQQISTATRRGVQLLSGALLPTPDQELLVENDALEVTAFDGVVVAGLGAEIYAHPGVCVRAEAGSTVHLAPGASLEEQPAPGALERADLSITRWDMPR